MQVLTPDGYKDVATLGVGDEVIGRYNVNTITELDHMVYDLTDPEQQFLAYTINGTYTYFQEQLVLLNDVIQMRHARELVVGDVIIADSGSPITITTITTAPATEWWHFTISDDHTFIADGLMLHNSTITCGAAGGVLTTGGTWVGGVAPGAGDDAVIDSTCTANVSLAASNWSVHGVDFSTYVKSFTCSTNRTLTVGGGVTLTTAASLTFASGMTISLTGTFTITFDCRNASGITVTTNAVSGLSTVSTVNLNTNAVSTNVMTLADSFDAGAAAVNFLRGTCTITSGKTLTTTGQFAYTGTTGTGTLVYSGATISCGNFSNSGAGGTFSPSGNSSSLIECTSGTSANPLGAVSYPGTLQFDISGAGSISGAATCVNFSVLCSGTSNTFTLAAGITITGTLTITGTSNLSPVLFSSDALGTARTITNNGTNALTDVIFRDITGAGTATWTGTRLGNAYGLTSITTQSPRNCYYIGHTGNWNASGAWSASSGGASDDTYYPLPQDTAIFDNSSFTADGQTVTSSSRSLSGFDMSAVTNHTFTFQQSSGTPFFYGDIVLNSRCTFSVTSATTTAKRGTQQFTTNSAIMSGTTAALTINNISGTFQPQDDFSWSGNVALANGTFNPLSNVTVLYLVDTGTATKAFTGTAGKTLTLVGPPQGITGSLFSAVLNGTTCTGNGMNMTVSYIGAGVVDGSSTTWGVLSIATDAGAGVTIIKSSNTWASMTVTGGTSKTIKFTSSTTQTLQNAMFFRGAASNLITIAAVTAATPFTLTCNAGYVATDYISLQDCTASGKINFFAGSHSTSVSGNTAWNFTDVYIDMPGSPVTMNIKQAVNRAGTY